jgi:tetratricopeptide (TPR) repeat protein
MRMLVCVLCCVGLTALGQTTAKPPVTGGSTTGTTGTTPTTPPPSFPTTDPFSKNGTGIQGRLIPGPNTRVQIELYENGARVDSAFSQSDGSFNFPRAKSGTRYEVRIVLGSNIEFRQEMDFQPGIPAMIQINVPQYLHTLNPSEKASGGLISVANLMAPKKAVQEFEKGRELGLKKKYDEGMEHLQKAIGIYAKYPDAYNEMGLIEKRQEHLPQAVDMFHKAIDADPKWTGPYLNLAQIQMAQKDYPEMFKTTGKVLELDPNIGMAHYMQSIGFLNTKKLDDAEKEALLAEKDESTKIAQIQLVLGNVYEMRGNSADAIVRYRRFLTQSQDASNSAKLIAHINDLEHPEKVAKAAGNP